MNWEDWIVSQTEYLEARLDEEHEAPLLRGPFTATDPLRISRDRDVEPHGIRAAEGR